MSSTFSKRSVLSKQIHASLIVEYASELIQEFWGKDGRKQAKGLHLKKNVLTIAASNSLIAQELKFKQNKIIKSINEKFGDDTIKKIIIVQKAIDKKDDFV